jgi:hypothetical protein
MRPRRMIVKSLVVGGLVLLISMIKAPDPQISPPSQAPIKLVTVPLPRSLGRDLCGLDCGGLSFIRPMTADIRKVRIDDRTGTVLNAQ